MGATVGNDTPVHDLKRKQALAYGRITDNANKITATLNEHFDLGRTIFKTLPPRGVKALFQRTKLDADFTWDPALAAEIDPEGPAAVVEALAVTGGPGPAAGLWAIDAVSDLVDLGDPALEPAPTWADQLLTSICEAAWIVGDWRGDSAAFRFVDAADERHVLVLDLVPGAGDTGETIGEATVGPAELLDATADESAGLKSRSVPAPELAERVARAMRSTSEPSASFVAVGRVVLADSRPSATTTSNRLSGSNPMCLLFRSGTPTTTHGLRTWCAAPSVSL